MEQPSFFRQLGAPVLGSGVVDYLGAWIAQHCSWLIFPNAGTHLVNVGSGPALEVARALERVLPELRRSVRVTLIDIDPAAFSIEPGPLGICPYLHATATV